MRSTVILLSLFAAALLSGCGADPSKSQSSKKGDPAETLESKMDFPAALNAKIFPDDAAALTAYYESENLTLNPNVFHNQGRVTIQDDDAKALYDAFAIHNPERYTNTPGWRVREKSGRHWNCRYLWKPGTTEETYVCQFGIDFVAGTAAGFFSNLKTENWFPAYEAWKRKPQSYNGNLVTLSGDEGTCDATVKLVDDDARALYGAMTAVEAKAVPGEVAVLEKSAPNLRCLKGQAKGGVIYSCRISLDCWTGELKPLTLK